MPEIVTTEALARLLGVTDRLIRELARKGIIVRTGRGAYELEKSVSGYCAHLREIAAGRGGQAAGATLAVERARVAKEQADGLGRKNALARAELVEAVAVRDEWSAVLRVFRAGMLAVSSRVQQRLGHLTAHDISEIDLEIRAALTEAGHNYNIKFGRKKFVIAHPLSLGLAGVCLGV